MSNDSSIWLATAKLLIDLIRVVIWPILLIGTIAFFRTDLSQLLTRAKQFVVKVGGVEVTYSAAEAGPLLAAVLNEISDTARSFGERENRLLKLISDASGTITVDEICKKAFSEGFNRNSDAHNSFRVLHAANLIRPREGDMWLAMKHPELTTLGRLVVAQQSPIANAKNIP